MREGGRPIRRIEKVERRGDIQASKGKWWMPRQAGPKKDVVTLRKAAGSRLQADPQISEWGNPPPLWVGTLTLLGVREASGGTETSKYPEEKKQFP